MNQVDRNSLLEWQRYKEDIANSTQMDRMMTHAEIEKKRIELEKDDIAWIQYFFPKYAKYPFAPFHKKAIRRVMENGEWYEIWSWSRELAKSTIAMFCVTKLVLTRRKKSVILFSSTQDSAEKLLAPFIANFECNGRLQAFYGDQSATTGEWSSKTIKLANGATFYAIGGGNAPRGTRNENIRPDVLLGDDYDTDEACRNPETLKKKWDWYNDALYPTRSISEPTLVLLLGNIIAKDCCITRASQYADHHDIVNIRDKNGRSTWPDKNTEEDIDRVLSKVPKSTQQKEYFNNPVSEGKIFVNLIDGKIPDLSKFKFLVIYGDPAPSESKKKGTSFKAVWLEGKIGNKLYVIKGFLDHCLTAEFIEHYITLLEYVGDRVPVYCYLENNKLQDPFFKQVYKPKIVEIRNKKNISLNIIPDEERKTDKATRIEADLEPLDREGDLIFNIDEKDNPNMSELKDQFTLFDMHLPYAADGPDCIQGGLRSINNKNKKLYPSITIPVSTFTRRNKNRI